MKLSLKILVLFILCVWSTPSAGADIVLPDGVQALEPAGKSIEDPARREAIAQWAKTTSQRAPEFLGDLIKLSAHMQNQSLFTADLSAAEAFIDKWQPVVKECPECTKEGIANLLVPILNEVSKEMTLAPTRTKKSGPPFQKVYAFYKQAEKSDLMGLGSAFAIEPLPSVHRRVKVTERTREITRGGVKTIEVVKREVVETIE